MGVRRVLGVAGRTMLSTGVLVLIFVVYQLWGTGLRTNGAQDQLRERFDAARQRAATAPALPSSSALPGTTSDPSSTTPTTETVAPLPPPAIDDAVGEIRIPRIGATHHVVEGVGVPQLKQGPGHFPETPLPGQPGNAAIGGHRTTHGGPFNRIDELLPGDRIEVDTVQGTFTYAVVPQGGMGDDPTIGHRIVTPRQTEILSERPGRNTLTLMACHPKGDLKERIVVLAELVTPPAPPTPRPTPAPASELPDESAPLPVAPALDLAGGDDSARAGALAWSLLASAVWLVAWFVARSWPSWRTWQRWAVFVAATPVFAVPLYFALEAINNSLPGGY